MKKEIWKKAYDFENYEVSNYGNVKSLFNQQHQRRDKILKPFSTKAGYLRVCLRKNNKSHYIFIHRLVLNSFNPINNKLDVNHKNGIKFCNLISNLEWCTKSENQIHAYKIGLQKPIDNGLKKKISIISENGINTYISIREMCRKEKLNRSCVQRYLKGEIKSYKNLIFKFA